MAARPRRWSGSAAAIISIIDQYIRTRLFATAFDPFHGSDWKILLSKGAVVTDHIVKEVSVAIYWMQQSVTTTEAVVEHTRFSSVTKIKMREEFSLPLQKTIYERQGFPSHGGGLEKAMLQLLDRDADVERFLKVNEYQHPFAVIYYIRDDGLLATYHPDFIVGTVQKIYLIETKGNDKVFDRNVQRKQRAALEWTRRINALPPAEREDRQWEYVLLSEDNFYSLTGSGATLTDMCEVAKVSPQAALGLLFSED